MNMPEFRLDWFVLVGIGICMGALLSYSPNPNLDAPRLCNRIDHALDIVQDLKELGQNIAINDATDYFEGGDNKGCGKQILMPSDIVLVGTILDTKTQQAYEILHQVLVDLKAA